MIFRCCLSSYVPAWSSSFVGASVFCNYFRYGRSVGASVFCNDFRYGRSMKACESERLATEGLRGVEINDKFKMTRGVNF